MPNNLNAPVSDGQLVPGIAERLRDAVHAAGGPGAVAKRAEVSDRTLYNYLQGGDPKASSLVKLAAACGVSVEWLATGREYKLPGEAAKVAIFQDGQHITTLNTHRVVPPIDFGNTAVLEKPVTSTDQPPPAPAEAELWNIVDVPRLGRAVTYVRRKIRGGVLSDTEFARAIIIAYDLMGSKNTEPQ